MPELHLASGLSIPLEAVTQTFAILAKRGSGKTYTALVMVEEMLKAGLQTVVVDPVGVCWGLRAAANGRDAGLPIIVLGGEHGDVAIEATAGAAIADFVIEEGQSVVIDLSGFSNNEMVRVVTDFAERLYQKNRSPLHLILDEADSFAPQKPMPGEQRMLGAIDKIVRRGRARGLGVSLVSQRPAVINKNVLTQIEVLIALRTVSPQDRKAIESWIEVHGTPEQRDELMSSLPSLPIGTAWVWSPGWLNVFQRVQIRQRETFDSSATPTWESQVILPRKLAAVDLSALRQRISASVQPEAKEGESKQLAKLRQRVMELEQQLHTRVVDRIEVPIFQDGEVQRLEAALESLLEFGNRAISIAEDITSALKTVTVSSERPLQEETASFPVHPELQFGPGPTKPQQRILDALAEFEALGLSNIARHNLAVFSGQSPTSSGYTNNLGRMRTLGLIDYPGTGIVQLTEKGRLIAKAPLQAKSMEALHNAWYSKLPKPQAKILQALVERYPKAFEREALAELVGQSATSSGYTNNLGALRSLGLVDYPKSKQVAATKLLFPLH